MFFFRCPVSSVIFLNIFTSTSISLNFDGRGAFETIYHQRSFQLNFGLLFELTFNFILRHIYFLKTSKDFELCNTIIWRKSIIVKSVKISLRKAVIIVVIVIPMVQEIGLSIIFARNVFNSKKRKFGRKEIKIDSKLARF